MKILGFDKFNQSKYSKSLFISPDFFEILSSSPVKETVIGDKLLTLVGKEVGMTNNYFDLSDDSNQITFLTPKKASELEEKVSKSVFLSNGFRPLTRSSNNDQVFNFFNLSYSNMYRPSAGEVGIIDDVEYESPSSGNKYVKIEYPSGVFIVNKNYVEKFNPNNKDKNYFFKSRLRTFGRVGSAISTLLKSAGVSFTDKDLQDFVNAFKAGFDTLKDVFKNFKLVTGDDIKFWYNERNYVSSNRITPLSQSCMRYTLCGKYLEIYVKNPQVCKLLILVSPEDSSKIKGRAIVWTLSDGKIFIDRIYYIDESDVTLFRIYAKEKKWYSKKDNNSTNYAGCIDPNDAVVNLGDISVNLGNYDYEYYPYMDTLKYYNSAKNKLSNYPISNNELFLEDTSGGYSSPECRDCDGRGEVECYECSGRGEVGCSNCDDGRVECPNCDNGQVQCSKCDGHGEIDGNECDKCSGTGEMKCTSCGGDSLIDCDECNGSGEVECYECSGRGEVECSTCDGSGREY